MVLIRSLFPVFQDQGNFKLCIFWLVGRGARTKPAPLAVLVPFPDQAHDLVKHDCRFTLLSSCPQDWKLLESKNGSNCSLQPQAEDNIGTNGPGGPHNNNPAPTLFKSNYKPIKAQSPHPSMLVYLHAMPLSFLGE